MWAVPKRVKFDGDDEDAVVKMKRKWSNRNLIIISSMEFWLSNQEDACNCSSLL